MRRRVRGTDARPRLCVFRSGKHIYVQVISDETGRTLAAASTLSPAVEASSEDRQPRARRKQVGERDRTLCARSAASRAVVFDRNGFLYHGRVQGAGRRRARGGAGVLRTREG